MDCKECKSGTVKMPSVSYAVYEGAMMRNERHIKRLWIALIIAVILIFASNGIWLLYLNQYDVASTSTTTTSIEASQDGEGINIVGGGDIEYGAESESGS